LGDKGREEIQWVKTVIVGGLGQLVLAQSLASDDQPEVFIGHAT